MGTLLAILWLVLGLAALVAGAEVMLRGAVSLAHRLGVPTFIIGLTVVAFGTSAPELAAGVGSVVKGETELIVGTVVGSNVANIGLVLGIAALIRPARVRAAVVRREVPVMIGVSILFIFAMLGGAVTRLDAMLLLLGMAVFLTWAIYSSRHLDAGDAAIVIEAEQEELAEGRPRVSMRRSIVLVVLGLGLMVLGSDRAVEGAREIAVALGVPSFIIGLTLVAFGTSLPEVVTSVVAALRGQSDIAVGNVLGSNIFNVLAVIGACAALDTLTVPDAVLARDAWVMLGFAVVLLPVMLTRFVITRAEAALLLAGYAAYVVVLALA
ncbi:MAG: calcium/sodium antiporter [Planctomycetota bacterium]